MDVIEKGPETELDTVNRQTLCSNGEKRTFLLSENLLYEEAVTHCRRLGGELGMEWKELSSLKTLFNGTCKSDRPVLAPIRQGSQMANGSFKWYDDRTQLAIQSLNWDGMVQSVAAQSHQFAR